MVADARIEHDKALRRVIIEMMKDDTATTVFGAG